MMKKLALLSMLLGLGLCVTGCGETKPPPKASPAPPAQTETAPPEDAAAPKEGEDMPKEGAEPSDLKPEGTEEPAADKPGDAPADEKPADEEGK